jgi:hypothetical protein
MKMKSIFIFISIIILIIQVPLFATNDSSFVQFDENNFSIQFLISRNFSLYHFQGSFLSAKYHINNSQAIRIGMDMNVDISSQEENLYGRDRDAFRIYFASQYVFYLKRQNVYFYYGLGPNFSFRFNNARDKKKNFDQTNYQETDKKISHDFGIGLNTVYGIEIFIVKQVSLLAEYGHVYEYSYLRTEDKMHGISETYSHIFKSNPVKFGVSVYF